MKEYPKFCKIVKFGEMKNMDIYVCDVVAKFVYTCITSKSHW